MDSMTGNAPYPWCVRLQSFGMIGLCTREASAYKCAPQPSQPTNIFEMVHPLNAS